MKKIIFYAPLGKNTPPDKIGGAEAGCLKTKKIYENAGFLVVVIDKPAMSQGRLRFLIEMLITPIKMLFTALREGKKTPVHIVGFYTKIAKYEWLLMKIAHFCGNKVIYELRNGSMITTYEEGSDKYRKTLEDLLLQPEIVLCQGQEYVDFIRSNWNVERSYYPNYIMDDFMKDNELKRPHPLRLIYFGRVTKSKNIDIIITVLYLIRKRGIDAILDVIGGYDDEYKKYLDNVVSTKGIDKYVSFYGRKPFRFIAEKLRKSHYFVFPSTEKQEGHSNSLTEAMGCGVVPIVSTVGFNCSICGCDELVVNEIDAEDFANKIIRIENNNEWAKYSNLVYDRVKANFTQSIVSKKLIGHIDKLF